MKPQQITNIQATSAKKVPFYLENYSTANGNILGLKSLFNFPGKKLGSRIRALGQWGVFAGVFVFWAFRPTKEDYEYYFAPKK
jgi:hypothetical protein